jgi:hypothetical protein
VFSAQLHHCEDLLRQVWKTFSVKRLNMTNLFI